MSWNKAELTSICDVFTDGDWIESKDQSENGIRLIQTGNVGFGKFKARESKARYVSEETFKRLRCTEIKQGDILVSRLPDPVGRACVIPELDVKSITAVDCTIIRTKKEIISTEFLNYFCQSPQYFQQVNKNITGATRQRISRSLLGKTEIPLPPLTTQKKIVAKLDAIFTEIDKATAAAEANAKNAEALFQSYLRQVFERGGENWITSSLKDVCEKITDGTHQTPTYFDDGVIFLSSKNVTSGKIDWDKVKYIDNKQHIEMSKRVSPKVGDVLLAKNGTTGVAAIVDRDVVFDIYVSLALLRAKEQILPKFLLYFVNSPVAKNQFNSRLKGIGVPNLHLQEIREVLINFPKSLDEQKDLIKQIETFWNITTTQGIRYKNKKEEISILKQSILKQAFAGEFFKE